MTARHARSGNAAYRGSAPTARVSADRSRVAEVGVLDDLVVGLGHGLHRRHLLALHDLERGAGVEALDGDDGGAGREGAAQRHGETRRPEVGELAEQLVVGGEAHGLAPAPALDDRRAVGVQHALGVRAGARGVDDDAGVARVHLGHRRVEELVGHLVGACDHVVPVLDGAPAAAGSSETMRRRNGKATERSWPGTPSASSGWLSSSSSTKRWLNSEAWVTRTEASEWRRM